MKSKKREGKPEANNGVPVHPLVAEGTGEISEERKARKKEQRSAQGMMDAIVIGAILLAIIPQIWYELILWNNPAFELSWAWRDRFFLFSTTSHLTSIVILLASIVFVRIMGKHLDNYDELLERGMADYERMKSRLLAWSFDLDSFSESMDGMVEVYHSNKKAFKLGIKMMPKLLPVIPALERKFGQRLENFDTLTTEEQDEVIKTVMER